MFKIYAVGQLPVVLLTENAEIAIHQVHKKKNRSNCSVSGRAMCTLVYSDFNKNNDDIASVVQQ